MIYNKISDIMNEIIPLGKIKRDEKARRNKKLSLYKK